MLSIPMLNWKMMAVYDVEYFQDRNSYGHGWTTVNEFNLLQHNAKANLLCLICLFCTLRLFCSLCTTGHAGDRHSSMRLLSRYQSLGL